MQDVLHSPEHLSLDEISSPTSVQIFEFCDPELFQETLQNSEVASSSNCCYEDTNKLNRYHDINGDTTTVNLSPSPSFLTSQQDQNPITDGVVDGLSQYVPDPVVPLLGPLLPSVFEQDCLSSYQPLNPTSSSCSLLCPPMGTFMPGTLNAAVYAGGILKLQPQDLDFQGQNGGMYCPDSMHNPGDFQAQLVSSTPLTSEISSLEEASFKVGKLSVEQRKEKIHRYMKKRNERNFNKKIKYACRKTLADSRPRVRGRFAKNDDFREAHRPACTSHEEDDEEIFVKEEEEDDMADCPDIFAHISGVNSFNCNNPIQTWI